MQQWAPPAGQQWQSAQAPAKSPPHPLVLAAVGVVAAFLGYMAVQMLLAGGGADMPDSIQGAPRIQSEEADKLTSGLQDIVEAAGGKAEIAMYGDMLAPVAMLVVFEEGAGLSFDSEWDSFSGGFSPSGMDDVQDQQIGGKTLRCGGSQGMTLCLWGEGQRYAAVVYFGDGVDQAMVNASKDLPATAEVGL